MTSFLTLRSSNSSARNLADDALAGQRAGAVVYAEGGWGPVVEFLEGLQRLEGRHWPPRRTRTHMVNSATYSLYSK